jgi:hypothetical protein
MDAAARGFNLKDNRQLEIYENRIKALKLPTKNQ